MESTFYRWLASWVVASAIAGMALILDGGPRTFIGVALILIPAVMLTTVRIEAVEADD